MIEKAIKNLLNEQVKGLLWSANYKTQNDNYGVVYYEGGDPINVNDETKAERLNYQVEINSSDFDKAKFKAHQVYTLLHGLSNQVYTAAYNDNGDEIEVKHKLHFMAAETPPLRIGVIDDKMIYTINFVANVTPFCK